MKYIYSGQVKIMKVKKKLAIDNEINLKISNSFSFIYLERIKEIIQSNVFYL